MMDKDEIIELQQQAILLLKEQVETINTNMILHKEAQAQNRLDSESRLEHEKNLLKKTFWEVLCDVSNGRSKNKAIFWAKLSQAQPKKIFTGQLSTNEIAQKITFDSDNMSRYDL